MNPFQVSKLFAPPTSGRPVRFLALLISALISSIVVSDLDATPVTMAFDAVVALPPTINGGYIPQGLDPPPQIGDAVSGSFTFEPYDAPSGASETAQDFVSSFVVRIN
jgi:hypothetical protein